jgi:hypothetical protein
VWCGWRNHHLVSSKCFALFARVAACCSNRTAEPVSQLGREIFSPRCRRFRAQSWLPSCSCRSLFTPLLFYYLSRKSSGSTSRAQSLCACLSARCAKTCCLRRNFCQVAAVRSQLLRTFQTLLGRYGTRYCWAVICTERTDGPNQPRMSFFRPCCPHMGPTKIEPGPYFRRAQPKSKFFLAGFDG